MTIRPSDLSPRRRDRDEALRDTRTGAAVLAAENRLAAARQVPCGNPKCGHWFAAHWLDGRCNGRWDERCGCRHFQDPPA